MRDPNWPLICLDHWSFLELISNITSGSSFLFYVGHKEFQSFRPLQLEIWYIYGETKIKINLTIDCITWCRWKGRWQSWLSCWERGGSWTSWQEGGSSLSPDLWLRFLWLKLVMRNNDDDDGDEDDDSQKLDQVCRQIFDSVSLI